MPVSEDFAGVASSAFRRLRDAVAMIASALGSGASATPAGFTHALGLSRSLGWRIWRIGYPETELPSPGTLPGVRGYERFLEASVAADVERSLVDEARDAFARVRDLMRRYAPDETSFDAMVSRLGDRPDRRVEQRFRKELFDAHAYLLGVRSAAMYGSFMAIPGPDPLRPEFVFLSGFFGVTRTRVEQRWLLNARRVTNRFRAGDFGVRYEALDDTGGHPESTSPLMREFCSTPAPPVSRRRVTDTLEDELDAGPVGIDAAADVVFGEVLRGLPPEPEPEVVFYPPVRLPTERMCLELILHRDVHDGTMPLSKCYSAIHDRPSFRSDDDRDRLPVEERITHVGRADAGRWCPWIPRHRELVMLAMSRVGEPASAFEVYRLEMAYPPIPSVHWLEFRRRV